MGLGVAAKAAFKVSSCLALIVVRGPLRLAPRFWSSFSLLPPSLSDTLALSESLASSCDGSWESGDKLGSLPVVAGERERTREQECRGRLSSPKPSLLPGGTPGLTRVEAVLFGDTAVIQVILFTDELVLINDVELLAGGKLLVAHHAGEAVEVKHFAPGSPNQIAWRDALRTTRAFGTEASAYGGWGLGRSGRPEKVEVRKRE